MYGGQTCDDHGTGDINGGAPELIVETSFSSRSTDLGERLRDYERAGVREYVVLVLRDAAVRRFGRLDGRFERLEADAHDLFRSRFFPGLWIDAWALFRNDKVALIAAMNRGLASPEHAAFVAELARRRDARAAKS